MAARPTLNDIWALEFLGYTQETMRNDCLNKIVGNGESGLMTTQTITDIRRALRLRWLWGLRIVTPGYSFYIPTNARI